MVFSAEHPTSEGTVALKMRMVFGAEHHTYLEATGVQYIFWDFRGGIIRKSVLRDSF